ncbi:NADPH:quinone reductase [Pontibacillus salicampi]|uniref:NADPH:quinone reductase n=1 Tax=Pontibacillus salicampi TaxID=1449801 RepID=A0ABV6LUC1_9BACI
MKAAWFNQFGEAKDVLEVGEIEKPQPGHGEVLIRMKTSGVNPSDTKKRSGSFLDLLDNGAVIPNSDGAGIIEAVGTGVPHSRIGERVWVYQAQYNRLQGTAAQYVAIDTNRAVRLPETTSFVEGAGIGIPIMTAHRCVFSDGPVEDQLLFITGGAGRVGHYAIQLAKQAGATVITTASNEAARQFCFEAGADLVVDHTKADMVEHILEFTNGQKVDRVIDVEFGANLDNVLQVIKIGGTIATYSSTVIPEPKLPFKQMMFMNLTIRMVIVYAMPEEAKKEAIRDITAALEQNRLQHRTLDTFSLDEIEDANIKVEQGEGYGSVIVEIP